jgi:hypothetical protein
MHAPAELLFELLEFALHLLPHRLPKHGELPFSRLPADMRESEKIEAVGLAFSPCLGLFGGGAAEFDQARFVGVQFD